MINDDRVVFGSGSLDFGVSERLYQAQGDSLQTVVDTNTPIPEGEGNFTGIGEYTSSSEGVAFVGGSSDSRNYIYLASDSGLERIGPIDFEPDPFQVKGLAMDGQNVVYGVSPYALESMEPPLLFLYNGNDDNNNLFLTGRGDPIPGTEDQTFTEFGYPAISNNTVAFVGSNFTRGGGPDDQYGIYTYNITDRTSQVIADPNTPIPDGEGTFGLYDLIFSAPSVDGNNISFDTKTGIYRSIDQVLGRVVDRNTLIPGSTQSFENFGRSVIQGNQIAFKAGGRGISGIYITWEDELAEVIATGSQLQGKTVTSLDFGSSGLSGRRLVFKARFEDGSSGIFKAEPVPAPASTLGLTVLGAFGAGSLVRRRLKRRFEGRKLARALPNKAIRVWLNT